VRKCAQWPGARWKARGCRQLRKAIKTKGHFPNEEAARKLIYLAISNATPAWTKTRSWTAALLAFKIHFGDRLAD
jgi:transposase-like protein